MNIGIAGAAGYTAGELIRILINHPEVNNIYLQSESHKGEPVYNVHKDLLYSALVFDGIPYNKIDVLFLCMGHGYSSSFLKENSIPEMVKIIDLGNDFRLKKDAQDFVYGLPELNKEKISISGHVANPGCFATAIELGLIPLANSNSLSKSVSIFGITGSTGAGQNPTEQTHFSNRLNNLSNYKVFSHQHLGEIGEVLVDAGYLFAPDIAFVPVRGCHSRGIFADIVLRTDIGLKTLVEMYKEFYRNHPFTIISDKPVNLKQVVNTNYCFISLQKDDDKLLITSVIDNLLKGASGQAVQNMNLMFGLDEKCGLGLKANYF